MERSASGSYVAWPNVASLVPGPIEPNAELVSGTTFSLKIQTDLPLYLQVGRRTAQGVEPLLPPPGKDPEQARPGLPLLLPPGDGRIELNDQTGDEVVYVLASLRRLSPEDTAQAMKQPPASIEIIPSAAGGSRGVDETNSRNRGFDRNTMTLFGKVQADGTALLVFPFRHI